MNQLIQNFEDAIKTLQKFSFSMESMFGDNKSVTNGDVDDFLNLNNLEVEEIFKDFLYSIKDSGTSIKLPFLQNGKKAKDSELSFLTFDDTKSTYKKLSDTKYLKDIQPENLLPFAEITSMIDHYIMYVVKDSNEYPEGVLIELLHDYVEEKFYIKQLFKNFEEFLKACTEAITKKIVIHEISVVNDNPDYQELLKKK